LNIAISIFTRTLFCFDTSLSVPYCSVGTYTTRTTDLSLSEYSVTLSKEMTFLLARWCASSWDLWCGTSLWCCSSSGDNLWS